MQCFNNCVIVIKKQRSSQSFFKADNIVVFLFSHCEDCFLAIIHVGGQTEVVKMSFHSQYNLKVIASGCLLALWYMNHI